MKPRRTNISVPGSELVLAGKSPLPDSIRAIHS